MDHFIDNIKNTRADCESLYRRSEQFLDRLNSHALQNADDEAFREENCDIQEQLEDILRETNEIIAAEEARETDKITSVEEAKETNEIAAVTEARKTNKNSAVFETRAPDEIASVEEARLDTEEAIFVRLQHRLLQLESRIATQDEDLYSIIIHSQKKIKNKK